MTRTSYVRPLKFLGRLAPVLGAIVVIAGCGGSSKSHSSTTTSSTASTASTGTTTTKRAATHAVQLTEGIYTPGSKTPVTSATAAPGSAVSFATRAPGGPKQKSKVTVTLSLGPAKTLTVVATAKGESSTATLTSPNGKLLTLASVHYTCQFPPIPTACPLAKVGGSAKQDTVKVRARGGSSVIFGAAVGPLAKAPAIHPVSTSGATVPAYKLLARVRSTTPKTGKTSAKPSVPSTSVSVKTGDTVSVVARAVGTAGAPQPLTLKFGNGPAKSIAVTASVPNGVSQQLTITSASDKPISLVLPRYVCFLPPSPTFCPATQISPGASSDSAVFPVTPSTPPVTLLATVS